MVYAEEACATESQFCDLLKRTKTLLLPLLSKETDLSPIHFEDLVFEQMSEAAKGTVFEGTIKRVGLHAFPDIVAKGYFGVEVKMTTSDHWTSTGNSILESSRVAGVDKIYIMFGKFGGIPDVCYRIYHECLSEVSVTHSPRYRINMELSLGQSIFDKMGIKYDILRKDPNPIQKIKTHYRSLLKEGEELWWMEQSGDSRVVSPIIKPFRGLSTAEQEEIIVEAMILFPEMFGNSTAKFERFAAYLISKYNIVCPNARDLFSAGGSVKIRIKKKSIAVPRILHNLHRRAKSIEKKIKRIDDETLLFYWRINALKKDRLAQWKKLADAKTALLKSNKFSISASDVFDAGLA